VRLVELPDGGRLAVDVSGPERAPAVLLLRPLGGWRASWNGFATALARSLRVIAFDPRGSGDSSAARLSSTRAMARDALSVLDALAIERAHVYGLSLGGMVATWLALDAPDRVERLVLASTAAWGGAFRHDPLHLADVARCLARRGRAVEACLASHTLSASFRERWPDRVAAIRACAAERPASRRALVTCALAALSHDARKRLAHLRAETLVLAGFRDAILEPDEQLALARGVPHGRFAAVDAGHDVSAEAPDETAARVLAHFTHA
jgi:pimeloyl-ACP methyl ester carboxylesterase